MSSASSPPRALRHAGVPVAAATTPADRVGADHLPNPPLQAEARAPGLRALVERRGAQSVLVAAPSFSFLSNLGGAWRSPTCCCCAAGWLCGEAKEAC